MRRRNREILEFKDLASTLFLVAIVVAFLWTASLPLSKATQKMALRRFHLATPSFSEWSIQQSLPAMYNFENRYWYSPTALTENQLVRSAAGELIESGTGDLVETNLINHFPTRVMTFVGARGFLKQKPSGFFYLSSKYRGQEIRSAFKIVRESDDHLRIVRLETSFE